MTDLEYESLLKQLGILATGREGNYKTEVAKKTPAVATFIYFLYLQCRYFTKNKNYA